MAEREDPDPESDPGSDPDLDSDDSTNALRSFLTTLWSMVVDDDSYTDGRPSWIADSGTDTDALQRILARGVDPDDLTDVVRGMQHNLLSNVCQLVDDPGLLGIGLDEEWSEAAEFRWELVAVRTSGAAGSVPVRGLHSALDELDPSGRGGAPRGRPVPARLPGRPLYARLAVAQVLAGDRVGAITTWRKATGAPVMEAKAALDRLVGQVGCEPGDDRPESPDCYR